MENKCCCESKRHTYRSEELTKSLISRINRIEGQVRGIKGMVESNAYCDDILTQISAARAALDAVSRLILENHMHTCVIDKIRAGDDKIIDELMTTIKRML
ncbi:MAG TPA: metal-sensing transcriptional repressor [Firmicutes bacterium]|nr:metal-sensing transcriptional repressor [Bacillota bacterium]